MANLSGIKTVKEVFENEPMTIKDVSRGGIPKAIDFEKGREYIVPRYQREIRWSKDNVQILIDDLMGGKKFLGTITFSISEVGKFEIIDGQQRITVITLLLSYLNRVVPPNRQTKDLCTISNESFPFFQDALSYDFDYEKIKQTELSLYNNIESTDKQNQKTEFKDIWDSIIERINVLTPDQEKELMSALLESELNVIVNVIEGTDSQRKFCVDYFIDINNKSVELDSLDIIRAYAFKEDFADMTDKWINIQDKCNALYGRVKYTREDLYYQYFICSVNKEIDFKISKLSNEYEIKEDIIVKGKKYASGTFVWNIFKNDSFYSNLLTELNEYLDFIEVVLSTETGGTDEFKAYFKIDNGSFADETRILNAHTVINNILRNDDVVPKMMVMKYFLEVLRPERVKNNKYRIISWIGVVANVFTMSKKRKGSELIAGKLLQNDWAVAIRSYGEKLFKEVPTEIDFGKVARIDNSYTVESGQYMARRYFSMIDSCSGTDIDENVFKNENITAGDKNIEHFIVNREYTYAIYLEDGNTVDVEISIPRKYRKNIATIANYLILNSEVNSKLRNRPVYEKIEMLEKEIDEKGFDNVIPSKCCQRHYTIIKDVFYDNGKYPVKKLEAAKNKREKKSILKAYYTTYFEDEFSKVVNRLSDEENAFETEMSYRLQREGFVQDELAFSYDADNIFTNITAEPRGKEKGILVSAELYNPAYGEDFYSRLIDQTLEWFKEKTGLEAELHSSREYCECDDESISFVFRDRFKFCVNV